MTTKSKPWVAHEMSRKCHYAHCSDKNRPGMQPLTLYIAGKPKRGYWHLKCFEKARKELSTKP